MFTGIIEEVGRVNSIRKEGSNIILGLSCSFIDELKVDQSISHNGVCLTVTKIENKLYYVTAIHETLTKTNLANLKINSPVNLERCILPTSRLDGHIVQGHVDTVGTCKGITQINKGSWEIVIEHEKKESMV
jgi:riboflavin synthase